jgi:hypothetical protein
LSNPIDQENEILVLDSNGLACYLVYSHYNRPAIMARAGDVRPAVFYAADPEYHHVRGGGPYRIDPKSIKCQQIKQMVIKEQTAAPRPYDEADYILPHLPLLLVGDLHGLDRVRGLVDSFKKKAAFF